MICHAKFPNGLLHANKAWTALTKYEQHEIEGKPLSCLHGPLTDTGRIIQVQFDKINILQKWQKFYNQLFVYASIDDA